MQSSNEDAVRAKTRTVSTEKNNKAYQSNDIDDTDVANSNIGIHERMQHIGREFVDICHYIILGAVVDKPYARLLL